MTERDEALLHRLLAVTSPEDLFGPLDAADPAARLEEARRRFRTFARQVHPDRWASASPELAQQAHRATQRLNALWEEAERALEHGTWGSRDPAAGAALRSHRAAYTLLQTLPPGDLADLFLARQDTPDASAQVILKITRAAADADLADAERDALQSLFDAPPDEVRVFGRYLPRPLDAFRLPDGRPAIALQHLAGYRTLAEVRRAYPEGIDLRALAWMLRRALELLAWVHPRGLVHGAITPDHLLIHPDTHGAALIDWAYAVRPERGGHILALSPAWRHMYPPEVLAKSTPSPATDLYMLGQCALYLLNAEDPNHLKRTLPESVTGLLRALTIPNPHLRHQDAAEVYERLRDLLERLYGPPSFHPFTMPPRS